MRTLIALLLLAGLASAEHWGPFGGKREVGANGRYYVVLRQNKWVEGVLYSYACIGPDAPPVERVEYSEPLDEWSVGRGLREGDRRIRTGVLYPPPVEVTVSATGLGFAGLGEWWADGYGAAVTIVRADGRPPLKKKLSELFTAREIEAFPHSASSIWWRRAHWIDEAGRKLVIVGYHGQVRTVGWDDGRVETGQDEDFIRALASPQADTRWLALTLVRERRTLAALAAVKRIFEDETETENNRIHAAVVLAVLGDLSGKDLVLDVADPLADPRDGMAGFAMSWLPVFLGKKAIPRLTEAMREGAPGAPHGFLRLGAPGVPALEKLAEDRVPRAAWSLMNLGARSALLSLLAGDAADAARELGGDEVAPELTELLRRGTKSPLVVVSYFGKVRYAPVVPLLVAELEKAERPRRFVTALRFQTGKDFGEDVEAWKEWLEKR